MRRFKWLLFIIIIKTQLSSLKTFNIIIVLNISIFNIIECAVKLLMIMLIYNTCLLISKSLIILLKFFIKINSNFFINLLISNHVYKIHKVNKDWNII